MSNNTLQDEIINDLSTDFPDITRIERTGEGIVIEADDDTLWEIYEVLYNGLNDVELNMGKEEESHIIIKI